MYTPYTIYLMYREFKYMHEDKNKKNSCIHRKPTSSKTINLIVKLIASSQQIRNDQLMKLFDSLNHHYK